VSALGVDLFQKLSSTDLISPYVELSLRREIEADHISIPLPEHGSKRDFKFHPSSHCEPDERQLYYRLHPDYRDQLVDRKRAGMDQLSLIQGTIFHVVIQQRLKEDGWITDNDIERTMHSEEHQAIGHLDLLFPNHPIAGKDVPVDIKTASPDNFGRMFSPSWSYRAQLNCYMDWAGWDEGVIFVVEAGRPFRMKEFRVLRDELILHQVYSKWKRVREAIEANEVPEVCETPKGPCTVGSQMYKNCPARNTCVINGQAKD
jgi:hypothetical protein